MKARFTLSLLSLLFAAAAFAQNPYTVATSSQAYTPLTGAASANGATPWNTDFFTMPLGFSARIGSKTVTNVFTDGTDIYNDTTGASVDLFQSFFAHSVDRGFMGTVSKSPMRYATTGAAGSRVFKYEIAGGGFYEENNKYGTMLDSFSFQFWIYEGSNAVELHFGPAKISHAVDYFGPAGAPGFCGYFNVDFTTGMGNKGYFVTGSPMAPDIDSFTAAHQSPMGLSSYPAAGTVYRFTPKSTTGIAATGAALRANVYPTSCTGQLHVDMDEAGSTSYKITSLTGALAAEGSVQQGKNTLAADGLAAGMYILRLQSATGVAAIRFVKQ